VKYLAVDRVLWVLLGVLLAPGPTAGGVELSPPASGRARTAIEGLRSAGPAVRQAAEKTLLSLGVEGRPDVVRASRSDDPAVRTAAASVLMKLPWHRPDDSPDVQTKLQEYGRLDVEQRRGVVIELAHLTNHGFDALARLITEEPSDDVKWAIVTAVRDDYREDVLAKFRTPDASDTSATVFAAAGNAWMPKDAKRGANLLRTALALDLDHPSNDNGEVGATYDRLQNLALLAGDYDQLGKLLRMRAARNPVDEDGEPARSVPELFAAHATFGPLPGFEKDLVTYRDQLGDPRILFALGKVYERCGQPALAAATFRSAFLVDLVSVQERFEQGDFLLQHGWLDQAEAEFGAIFDLAPDHSGDPDRARPMPPQLDAANAHFRLARVAAAREDDAFAAEHMRKAMDLHYAGNGQLNGSDEQTIWHEINWHALRAARAAGDKDEINRRLVTFTSSTPLRNPDIANDVVPMLRAAGRNREADEVYAKVRERLETQTAQLPGHPMPKNNLAWLGARSGEQKAEALKLAQEATRAMPDNAAFVDTLAEAQFQNGNYAEAARLEARVVRARPTDRFLRGQLKRFEDAAAAKQAPAEKEPSKKD